MFRFELNPLTRRRLERFKSIRRGWWSFWILAALLFLTALGPLLVSHRALLVRHNGEYFLPTFGDDIPGTTFGLDYGYETNYRALREKFAAEEGSTNFVLMPPVPYSPREFCEVKQPVTAEKGKLRMKGADTPLDETRVFTTHHNGLRKRLWTVVDGELHGEMRGYDTHGTIVERGLWEHGKLVKLESLDGVKRAAPTEKELASLKTYVVNPAPPGLDGHLLGTDESGQDVVARLFGGFRILIAASLIYMGFTYSIGIVIGCTMGYYGGWFDLLVQRFIEIWSNIPSLYVIIFLASIVTPNLLWLMLILVAYSWISLTYYMRTGTYREKGREYVNAARLLGAGDARIIFRHILPNTLATLVTFVPFSVAEVTASLTALDFLGFGLPPTEPTWGELLRQGTENFDKPWIILSVVTALVVLMMLVSFVGEAIREAYSPKKHTTYA